MGEWVNQCPSRCRVAKWPGRRGDKWAHGHGGRERAAVWVGGALGQVHSRRMFRKVVI